MSTCVATVGIPQQSHPPRLPKRAYTTSTLLVGWLFFWVSGIAHSCCETSRDLSHNTRHGAHIASDIHHALEGGHAAPVEDEDGCPQVSPASVAPIGKFALLSVTVDFSPDLMLANHPASRWVAEAYATSIDYFHPPPPSRPYLRGLRLLI